MQDQGDEQAPTSQPENTEYQHDVAETPEQFAEPVTPAEGAGNTAVSEPTPVQDYHLQDVQAEQAQPLVHQDWEHPAGGGDVNTQPVVPAPSEQEGPTVAAEPTTPAPAPAVKSKKKWLVPVIAVGAVVLLSGSASAYYFGVYDKPENVLLDAFNNLSTAKAVQSNSVLTLNKSVSPDLSVKDVKLNTDSVGRQSGMVDATLDMEYKGKAIALNGKAIVSLADSAAYFQANNIKQAIQAVLDAEGATSQVPAGYFDSLDTLQGQWVKVTVADIKKNNESAGKDLECAVNVLNKHSNDTNAAMLDVYKKNPFVVIKQDMGVKAGDHGYVLDVDQTKAKAFGNAMKDTALYKDMQACNFDNSTDMTPSTPSTGTETTTYTVWVDQWSHQLKKVEMNGTSSSAGESFSYNGTMNVAYDPSVKVAAPNGAISVDEFMKRYNAAAAKMGMPDSTSLEQNLAPAADSSNTL